MFDPKRVQQDFSDAAKAYDDYAALQQKVLESLLAMVPVASQTRILDAGCGTGRLARRVHAPVTQIDLAYAMCAKAAESGMPAINARIEALPFADASFDIVFSSLVLQWVPDWQRAIAEMRRVLKTGGMLAISSFGPSTLKELKESFAAVDRHSHVSSFPQHFEPSRKETITEHYPDLRSLMRYLKAIGARNKLLGRRKSLMTRGQFDRMENRYKERFATKAGLQVTWEILYLVERS